MSENELKIDSLNDAIAVSTQNTSVKVQKIYSTPHFICLVVRQPGKTQSLCIGRGGKFQSLAIVAAAPPSGLRIIDKFLEFLRSNIRNKRIAKLEDVDGQFGLIHLVTKDLESYLGICIFENRLAFSLTEKKNDGYQTFLSWDMGRKHNHNELLSELKSLYGELGKTKTPKFDQTFSMEDYYSEQLSGLTDSTGFKKYKKALKRKMTNIQNDLLKLKEEPKIRSLLDKDEVDVLQGEKIKVLSWNFKFKSDWSKGKRKSHIYEKLKGLKRGLRVQNERLDKLKKQFNHIEEGNLENINFQRGDIIQPIWRSVGKKASTMDQSAELTEFFIGKIKGAIGNSARGNDQLRIKWGQKNNMWFHIEDYTGPHVVLKISAISEISMEELTAIASLMRDKSNLSIQEIGIIFTQLKNLKPVKGSPGKVLYKKIKKLTLPYKSDWMEIISVI